MKNAMVQTSLIVVVVVFVALTELCGAQTVRCYNCTGVEGADACGQSGEMFRGIGIPLMNCTGGCSKTVTTGAGAATVHRECGVAMNGKTCSKSGSMEICVHTCLKDFCNDSDVPRYTKMILVVTLGLAAFSRYLR